MAVVVANNRLVPIRGAWAIRMVRDVEILAVWRVTLHAGLTVLAEFDGAVLTIWSDQIPLARALVSLRAGRDYEVVDARAA